VHIADIQLAGIGRDFYNDVTYWVQEGVRLTQGAIRYGLPYIGPPIADQININYFGLIQPVIADTVYYLSDVFANPFNIIGLTGLYGSNLFYTGYEWVNSQAVFFGLPPLPFLPEPPPRAAVASTPSAASTAKGPRAAATVVEVELPAGSDAAEVAADLAAVAPATPAKAVRGELGRAVRAAARASRVTGAVAADAAEQAQQAGAEVSAAVQGTVSQVRSAARATRGAVGTAVAEARGSVQAAADSASDAASDATN
jgi:hypothetical protein